MKALLLSGSLGLGHDVVAEACSDSLRSRGWSTQTVDAMRMLGPGGFGLGQATFRGMLAVPGLFDALHFAAFRPGRLPALLADRVSRRKIVPRLRDHLDTNPADLAISAFASGASAVSWLADRYPAMSHIVICTDVTPHRLWVHPHVDLYLVTSAVAEAAVRRYEPQARVLVVPGPVRPGFYQPPSQDQARAALGVPLAERCVLLLSGGWGLGPVAAAAEALAKAGVHVLAVAGHNRRLERRLRAAAQRQPRVRPFGFTLEIPKLMAAADMVVTGAGADTCLEARTIGRPLLLLDVLQGHGRDNLQHELELGDAWVTSAGAADVVRTALAMLDELKPPQPGPTRSQAEWEAAFQSALAVVGLATQLASSGSSVAISHT
jgi:UDP-N-acetylglucosamine:LPS N-acetylglucosamine transferase